MSKKILLSLLGYGIFVVLPFIYMIITIHHLFSTDLKSATQIIEEQQPPNSFSTEIYDQS